MASPASLSSPELLLQLPAMLTRERAASADVIEFLIEIERRDLFLEQACSSLYSFCMERLGYSEDEAIKRVRVTRLARKIPSVLDELRSGALHLTGLFVLAPYLTEQNAEALLGEARGKSRRAIEQLLACWFPKPDVPSRIERIAEQAPLARGASADERPGRPATSTCPGAEQVRDRDKVEPLSAAKYRVEFTASAGLHAKIEHARALLSAHREKAPRARTTFRDSAGRRTSAACRARASGGEGLTLPVQDGISQARSHPGVGRAQSASGRSRTRAAAASQPGAARAVNAFRRNATRGRSQRRSTRGRAGRRQCSRDLNLSRRRRCSAGVRPLTKNAALLLPQRRRAGRLSALACQERRGFQNRSLPRNVQRPSRSARRSAVTPSPLERLSRLSGTFIGDSPRWSAALLRDTLGLVSECAKSSRHCWRS